MLIILSVLRPFIHLAIVSKRPLTLLEYPVVVHAVSIVIGESNDAFLGALDLQNAFFFVGGVTMVIEDLDGGVLIVDVRTCFVHVLVEVWAEERWQVL